MNIDMQNVEQSAVEKIVFTKNTNRIQLCGRLGISTQTLWRRLKEDFDPNFSKRVFGKKFLKPVEANYIVNELGYNDVL